MKPKVLLRIAAVLMLLHAVGHTMGALSWSQAPNARLAAVVTAMQTEHFVFMGRNASLALFYNGYGIIMIFALLFISVQLWLLSMVFNRLMVLAMGLFLLAMCICEYLYFFPFAAAFTGIAAVLTFIAYARQRV
jgi:hypothetical protein